MCLNACPFLICNAPSCHSYLSVSMEVNEGPDDLLGLAVCARGERDGIFLRNNQGVSQTGNPLNYAMRISLPIAPFWFR